MIRYEVSILDTPLHPDYKVNLFFEGNLIHSLSSFYISTLICSPILQRQVCSEPAHKALDTVKLFKKSVDHGAVPDFVSWNGNKIKRDSVEFDVLQEQVFTTWGQSYEVRSLLKSLGRRVEFDVKPRALMSIGNLINRSEFIRFLAVQHKAAVDDKERLIAGTPNRHDVEVSL